MRNGLNIHHRPRIGVLSVHWCAAPADDFSATGVPFRWTVFSVREEMASKPLSVKDLRRTGGFG
ncbi:MULTISPECIES: hypothetical protein [Burkholderia]|uniref:hypothetical protein n=1 Tax=Burkholderia TaxID=32008 RepID=UPI000A7A92DB|nr:MULTISPECIES: hypothetical protein [Burkholderia]